MYLPKLPIFGMNEATLAKGTLMVSTIENIFNSQVPLDPPSQKDLSKAKSSLLYYIFKATIIETLLVTGLTAITLPFVVTTTGVITLITLGAAAVVANIALRALAGVLRYRDFKSGNPDDPYSLLNYFCPFIIANFSYVDTFNVVVHEYGHVAAAKSVYQGVDYTITVDPTTGGLTNYTFKDLTAFGKTLGDKMARAFVSAAGPITGVTAAIFEMITGYKVRNTHPEVAQYLNAMASAAIVQHAIYALSTFWTSTPSNDFSALWTVGINPGVSVALIIGIPLLLKIGMIWKSHTEKKEHTSFLNSLITIPTYKQSFGV
jgi:hypothetical protein